jgi:putative DNA methylase
MNRIRGTFGRQALPMVWDFAETNPFAGAGGDIAGTARSICEVLEALVTGPKGDCRNLDATTALDDVREPLISTDPPYYDNIGYADLSDFFYIWLRRSLSDIYPDLFSTLLVPKAAELVATPFRFGGSKEKARQFFEQGLGSAFLRIREAQNAKFPTSVFYAFKQAETDDVDDDDFASGPVASTGWETMLEGLIRARFQITGTWPVRSEMTTRNVGRGTNALASSVVLACRPRLDDAPMATRREFLKALKDELPDALRKLQHGSIAPVDLAQAAIGPGMAVFSRYSKVLETDGSAMTVRAALGLINHALDEVLAEQEGEYDPETRWAVAWFEQFGMAEGKFGDAETLSKAKDTAINAMRDAGILESKAGKVHLIGRDALDGDWDPTTERRLTIWQVTQYLVHAIEKGGEKTAADMLRKLGALGESAKDLAYRLYVIAERKKWAQEALAYNMLVKSWPELTKQAAGPSGETARLL